MSQMTTAMLIRALTLYNQPLLQVAALEQLVTRFEDPNYFVEFEEEGGSEGAIEVLQYLDRPESNQLKEDVRDNMTHLLLDLLSHLVTRDSCVSIVQDMNGIFFLLSLLSTYKSHSLAHDESAVSIIGTIAYILSVLSSHEECRESVMNQDGVNSLLETVQLIGQVLQVTVTEVIGDTQIKLISSLLALSEDASCHSEFLPYTVWLLRFLNQLEDGVILSQTVFQHFGK